jgi:hypothetical protein
MAGFCFSGVELTDSITRKIVECYEDLLKRDRSFF